MAADVQLAFSADQAQVDEQETVHGLTTYTDRRGASYAVGTRRHRTEIGLFRLVARHGRVSYRAVDTLRFPDTFRLPNGQSWSPCEDPGFGGRIAADTEGLTIYETGRRSGTLLLSSQGDDTFYTCDRQTLRPRRHFAVVDGRRVDGSSDCDGADTVSTPLPGYPHGLLVVQDGDNTPEELGTDGEPRVNTDFKLLDAEVLTGR